LFLLIKEEITDYLKEMPQEHLLQVSPEIAANEMLLKVPWKTTKTQRNSTCCYFKTLY
jgi:hypothetical protein